MSAAVVFYTQCMKFIKPQEWVTPQKNRENNPLADCFTPAVHVQTFFQILSYPIAAVVSGIGAVVSKGK